MADVDWRAEWGRLVHKAGSLPNNWPTIHTHEAQAILAADVALRESEVELQTIKGIIGHPGSNVLPWEAPVSEVVAFTFKRWTESMHLLNRRLLAEQGRADAAENEVERLTGDLAANAKLLARQCDLAREAETERAAAAKGLDNLIASHKDELVYVRTTYQRQIKALRDEIEYLKRQLMPGDQAP